MALSTTWSWLTQSVLWGWRQLLLPSLKRGNDGLAAETSASLLCVLCSWDSGHGWGLRVTRPRRGEKNSLAMFLIMHSTDCFSSSTQRTKRLSSQLRGLLMEVYQQQARGQSTITSDFTTDRPRKCYNGLLHTFMTMGMGIMWDQAVTWKLNFL